VPTGSNAVEFDPTCGGTVNSPDLAQWYSGSNARSSSTTVVVTRGIVNTGVGAHLLSGGTVSGQVTDELNPTGLAGVCVSLFATGTNVPMVTAQTNSDGAYISRAVPSGSYQVQFDPTCNGAVPSSDRLEWFGGSPNQTASTPVTVTSTSSPIGINAALGTVPEPPTLNSIGPGDGQLMVNWSAPASDGGSPITGYTASASDATNTFTCAGGGSSTGCTITGLANGTTYTVWVFATNSSGNSTHSNSSTAVPVTNPSAPTLLSVIAGNAQVSVSWAGSSSNGGSPITGYTASASAGTNKFTCAGGGSSTGCTITGLANGTNYAVSVLATNVVGNSPASNILDAMPSAGLLPQALLVVTSLSGTIGTPLRLTTSGGSGTGEVTFVVTDGTATGCSAVSGILKAKSAGTCRVTAYKGASDGFNAASSVTTVVTLFLPHRPATVTVSFSSRSNELTSTARRQLTSLSKKLLAGAVVIITSYAKSNAALAQSRGNVIKTYLRHHSMVIVKIKIVTSKSRNRATIVTFRQ